MFSGVAVGRFPATTTSSTMLDSSPLARFLYNSETNLSQLAAESQLSREQPLLSLMPGSFIFFIFSTPL